MVDAQEILIFVLLSGIVLSKSIRYYTGKQIVNTLNSVKETTANMRLPFGTGAEQLLVTVGSIAFYVSRVKNLRLYPLNHEQNKKFYKTMAIGVLVGMFMDLS